MKQSFKKNMGWLGRVASLVGALLSSTACAQSSVQTINASMQNGVEVVRIGLSEPLTEEVRGFATQSPARIALDLPGVSSALAQPVVKLQLGNLQTASVVEADGRTRLVLNLKHATSYRTEVNGSTVLLFLDSVAPAVAVTSSQLQDAGISTEYALKDLDFQRSSNGIGRLTVELGSSTANADVRVEGQQLVVDLLNTSLPEGLRRRWDVAELATPVEKIIASELGSKVRLYIETTGDWEHHAYQRDSHFVVEVHPKQSANKALAHESGFTGERLSLNFQNIEVRSLLQVIADFTNFNIVTSDTVAGTLTLRLKDVPWDQALHIIMEAKGLGMKKSGNVLWIAPKEEIDERVKRDFEAARKIEELEPLRTQGFQINYAKAEDLKKQLSDHSSGSGQANSTRFLSSRGSVIAEPRTNQLFVTDTANKLEEIASLLKKLDVPVRQVLIEARIVEARDTFGRSLGVKFGGGYNQNRGSIGSGYAVPSRSVSDVPNFNNSGTSASNPFVNMPAGLSNGTEAATLAVSIFNSSLTRFLSLELSAMEAEGVGKVISNPRLLTADQTQAVIEQGTEYPYTETAPNGATSISFKKAVLKLEVVPQITPEGNIILSLDLNKDSRGETTSQGVAIDTKHIKTQVLVENGGTVVIGGIFEMEETSQTNKVPLLGDIPGVGNLFKSRTRESSKREMMVFITPRMMTEAMASK